MIDLILIRKRWQTAIWNCRTYQGADIASDHSLMMCRFRTRLKVNVSNRAQAWLDMNALQDPDTKKALQASLAATLESGAHAEDDTEEHAKFINEALDNALKEVVPNVKRTKSPWISKETFSLADQKREARNKRDQSEENLHTYHQLCNNVRNSARGDKERWLREKCEDIEKKNASEHKSRKVYQLIKYLNRKWQPKHTTIKNDRGEVLQTQAEVLERWTQYCSNLYREGGEDQDRDENNSRIEELNNIGPSSSNELGQDMTCHSILLDLVLAAIERLKHNKSPGPDGICGEAIQAGGEKLAKQLTKLLNKILQHKKLTVEGSKSIVVVLPKKRDLMECSNYRTLSLLNHTCKVLLLIRRERSTTQQILILRLLAEKASRKNRKIYNCFVDFCKAFDTIIHDLIWATLRSYGIEEGLIDLLKMIYSDAKAAVRIGGNLGEWFHQEKGTRQEDPISPIIFTIYLERILEYLSDEDQGGLSVHGYKITNLRYADDIDLVSTSSEQLQQSLDEVTKSANKAGLKVNVGKTKSMTSTPSNSR